MASPQLENGYTKVAHEILEALSRFRLRGAEYACTLYVIRATYGWRRVWARIPQQEFANKTGYSPQHIRRTLRDLVNKNILESDDTTRPKGWRFNKDYDRWRMSGISAHLDEHPTKIERNSDTNVSGQAVALAELNRDANEVVKLVMRYGLNGVRPKDWGAQARVAAALLRDGYTVDDVGRACVSLKAKRRGRAFDVKVLKYEMAMALADAPIQHRIAVDKRLDAENKRKEAALRSRTGDAPGESRTQPPLPPEEGLRHIREALK